MARAVLEFPPIIAPASLSEEPFVRAYRLDWTFESLEAGQVPAGIEEDTVYYSEKYADQVWRHVEGWLRQVPYSDVTVQLVQVPLSEWLGSCLGAADEVSER